MKILKSSIFSLLLVGLIACSGKRTTEEAIKYNDEVVEIAKVVFDSEEKLIVAIQENKPADVIDEMYDEYLKNLNEIKEEYESMKPFDDEDNLRIAIVDFFDKTINLVENELAEIIAVHHKGYENLTNEELNQFLNTLEKFDLAFEENMEKVSNEQLIFAERYDFDIS